MAGRGTGRGLGAQPDRGRASVRQPGFTGHEFTRALDRVLLWNHYVVPQWTYGKSRTARWDRFSHAEPLPKYGRSGLPSLWWYDADKAAKIGKRS